MRPQINLKPEFVEFIPETLDEETLYISVNFATAAHKCCCGCGNEVVTPFSPRDWTLIFNGETVSLEPSIGNWSFPCKSHYWITGNNVVWAPQWSKEEIDRGRAFDQYRKNKYFNALKNVDMSENKVKEKKQEKNKKIRSILGKLKDLFS
jgi:hypothetical protein